MRKFEIAKGWKLQKINLPKRQTLRSAGYDFEAAEETSIPPIWRTILLHLQIKPILVHTGIKAAMEPDEALFLYNRSGNPLKKFLLLGNGVGVVDSDYYENPDNDGEIMFQFWNFGLKDLVILKGERIGQGVFKKFLLTDDDESEQRTRKGGLGHTES